VKLVCPMCGSPDFKVVEQLQSVTPCTLENTESGVEILPDPMGEFVREDSIGVILLYMCGNEECTFTVEPQLLNETFPKT
jgi:hypothetical protein